MEYDCRKFSKYLVFQSKSKTLDFDRNARYFESESLPHTEMKY